MMIPRIAGAAALAAALLAAPASADQHPQDRPEATGSTAAAEQAESPGAAAAESTAAAEQAESPGAAAAETTAAAEPPVSQGAVARAAFALDIVDREPTDAILELSNDHDRVYFFTELHRFQGQELVHRWEFGGEVVAEVPFGIDGPRWRVYSSKALDPARLGTWTVSVVDAAGAVVEQQSLDYVAAPEPVADAAPGQSEPAASQPQAVAQQPPTATPQPGGEATQPGPAAAQP
jgi:hypothetical protein